MGVRFSQKTKVHKYCAKPLKFRLDPEVGLVDLEVQILYCICIIFVLIQNILDVKYTLKIKKVFQKWVKHILLNVTYYSSAHK